MKRYKITYRWWFAGGSETGISSVIINAWSKDRAEERFNKSRYDCPIHKIELIP